MRSRIAPIAALVVSVGMVGCYWTKYDELARTHVEIFLAMTRKIEDLTGRDGAPPAALAEYRYPLERAEGFAVIAARRFEGRESLRAFREMCAAYARLLAAAERARPATPTDPATAASLEDAIADVRRAAARVEETLAAERG